MILRILGLVFLLIGIGFFVNWGTSSANWITIPNAAMGAILSFMGMSLILYAHPLGAVPLRAVHGAFSVGNEQQKRTTQVMRENVKRIQANAQDDRKQSQEEARVRANQTGA